MSQQKYGTYLYTWMYDQIYIIYFILNYQKINKVLLI